MHWHKKGELLPKKVLATSSSGVISAVALKYQKNILYTWISIKISFSLSTTEDGMTS